MSKFDVGLPGATFAAGYHTTTRRPSAERDDKPTGVVRTGLGVHGTALGAGRARGGRPAARLRCVVAARRHDRHEQRQAGRCGAATSRT